MAKEGAGKLISAVAEAWGKEPRVKNFEDRLVMQKGCFLLNEMGVMPGYKFGMYIRGPYSSELADDYYELLKDSSFKFETDIDRLHIEELSNIMSKGAKYLEAYSTLILAHRYNLTMSVSDLEKLVLKMKPALKKEIREASASIKFQ